MQKEKIRVYVLARELNMESKDLLDLCRSVGMDVKNQLSSLDPEQRDAIELMLKKGNKSAAAASATAAPSMPLQSDLSTKVRVLPPVRRPVQAAPSVAAPAPPPSAPVPVEPVVVPPAPVSQPVAPPAAVAPVVTPASHPELPPEIKTPVPAAAPVDPRPARVAPPARRLRSP